MLIIFLILIFILTKFKQMKQKEKFFFKNIGFISLVLFFALRAYVGTDYIVYKDDFEKIESIFQLIMGENNYFISLNQEIGYKLYISFFKLFTNNYFVFTFLMTVLDLILLKKIGEKYCKKNIILFYICFMAYEGILIQFNLYRNTKAILFFLYSLRYIENGERYKYYIFNFLGLLFHYTAFMYFFLYDLLNKKMKKKTLVVTVIITLLLFFNSDFLIFKVLEKILFLFPKAISIKLIFYLNSAWRLENSGFGIRVIEKIFLLYLIIKRYNSIEKVNKSNLVLINLFYYYLIIWFLTKPFGVLGYRISILLIPGIWLTLPIIAYSYKRRENIMLLYAFICINTVSMIFSHYVSNENFMNKYETFLGKYTSHIEKIHRIESLRTELMKGK